MTPAEELERQDILESDLRKEIALLKKLYEELAKLSPEVMDISLGRPGHIQVHDVREIRPREMFFGVRPRKCDKYPVELYFVCDEVKVFSVHTEEDYNKMSGKGEDHA